MSLLSLLVYIPLQIIFIPIAILGISLVAYKQMVVSKKLGISQTAIEVLNGRWTMHLFQLRSDEASVRLAKVLPNTSPLGLWMTLAPLWIKFKLSGRLFLYPRIPDQGHEAIGDLVVARTFYFDQVIKRVITEVDQFVVLGAGYDTRAYGPFKDDRLAFFELDQTTVQQHKRRALTQAGIASEHVHFVAVDFSENQTFEKLIDAGYDTRAYGPFKDDRLAFFELDQAKVQQHKRLALTKADIDSEHVNFVAVDFSQDSTFEKLIDAGYDPSRKTLFLWEGVTLYLDITEVRKSMQEVHDRSAPGSVLLADIYADRLVDLGKGKVAQKTLDYTNEGMGFSLTFDANWERTLAEFVMSESLAVGETFFMGSANDKGPFMVVVEMRR